ncbi:MAG: PQQ-binding-like beta-propeller repeat protein [Planctomycetota bacterium]|nr:PQQ-binding-like beta-propeller repeat protein [Planctomycetota bacterium]
MKVALRWLFTAALAATIPAQRVHLHPSGAFFTTSATNERRPEEVAVVSFGAGEITPSMLAEFGGARSGPRIVENLAFAMALARECEALKLARSAPTLARSEAAQQATSDASPAAAARARRATEALRDLRVAALIGAARARDDGRLRELFEHRYGRGGVRVQVRHVLSTTARSAPQPAAERAAALRQTLAEGASFDDLLAKSHDRVTRRLLRDPQRRGEAGVLPNYNYHRFGDAFADAVRGLAVGEVSAPVTSSVGVHLIQLVARTTTRLEDVAPALRKELASGKARSSEVLRLRARLLDKYGFAALPRPPRAAVADLGPPPSSEWPHYRGNAQLHGVSAAAIGDAPALAWRFDTEGDILSSPVIADGVVYVGSTDNAVYAIDLSTGGQRWRFETKDMVEAPPLFLDGRVYVGSADFCFYALNAADGALAWKHETKDQILGGANWFRDAAGRARLLVGSYDANVYCFDVDGGQPLWTYQTDNYVNGSPAIAGREALFGGCDAALHLVDLETGAQTAKVELGEGCQVAGSVAMLGDRAYFGHYGNEFLRVDLDAGEVEWRYAGKRQGFCSSPAVDERYVVFGGRDRHLHCARRSDGAPLWKFRTKRKVDASPVICGDKVVFGSGDGRLYMLRIADGAKVWSYDIGKPIYSSPAVVDGKIVVGAGDKRVYAFSAPAEGR